MRDAVRGLRLRFEAGTRTARDRIGWKDPLHVLSTDFPQTEALKRPGDLDVSVNGVPLGRVRLPDDPADSRGVLSLHLHEAFEWAPTATSSPSKRRGDAARRMLSREVVRGGHVTVRFEVPRRPGAIRGGLSLYGARMGAYPLDPTLFLDLAPDAPERRRLRPDAPAPRIGRRRRSGGSDAGRARGRAGKRTCPPGSRSPRSGGAGSARRRRAPRDRACARAAATAAPRCWYSSSATRAKWAERRRRTTRRSIGSRSRRMCPARSSSSAIRLAQPMETPSPSASSPTVPRPCWKRCIAARTAWGERPGPLDGLIRSTARLARMRRTRSSLIPTICPRGTPAQLRRRRGGAPDRETPRPDLRGEGWR